MNTDYLWWSGNLRWVRTLSGPACAIRVTRTTALIARACITRSCRAGAAVDRWKRFLSLVSDASDASG
jgi:hypothetical protein